MNSEPEADIDQQIDNLFAQTRNTAPHGAAQSYGFETRLKQALQAERGTLERFGTVCWQLGWLGVIAFFFMVAGSILVIDASSLNNMLTSCSNFFGTHLFPF